MERFDPSPSIQGSEKITGIFGYWPSFHDAEILEVHMSVADGEPWVPGSESPAMKIKVHLFEMTKDVTPEGYFVLTKHTLAQLFFRGVENIELYDFSFQNCIFDLEFGIETVNHPQNQPDGSIVNLLKVKIYSSVGLNGGFRCHSAEVVSVEPCDESGKPLPIA